MGKRDTQKKTPLAELYPTATQSEPTGLGEFIVHIPRLGLYPYDDNPYGTTYYYDIPSKTPEKRVLKMNIKGRVRGLDRKISESGFFIRRPTIESMLRNCRVKSGAIFEESSLKGNHYQLIYSPTSDNIKGLGIKPLNTFSVNQIPARHRVSEMLKLDKIAKTNKSNLRVRK